MSNQKPLQDLFEEINAMHDDEIIKCDIPVTIFIGEALALHTRAIEDFDVLSQYGLGREIIDKLLHGSEALQTAQANWEGRKTNRQKSNQVWSESLPVMLEMRSELLQAMQLAFRNSKQLLEALHQIRKGNTHADAIQDLSDLAVLGKANAKLLQAINFDLSQLDRARELCDEMGQLHAEAELFRGREDDKKVIRDKAYTYTKRLVDEVRLFGKHAYRHDKIHRKEYSSHYQAERRAKYDKRKRSELQTKEE